LIGELLYLDIASAVLRMSMAALNLPQPSVKRFFENLKQRAADVSCRTMFSCEIAMRTCATSLI
jgi:hypothetical protein